MDAEPHVMSTEERLIYMVNQIARNFATLPDDQAAVAVSDHIASFWDPRMRAHIIALAEQDDPRIGGVAAAAVARLVQRD